MQRTACYGTCPQYEVRIYESGIIEYEGKMFVEKIKVDKKQVGSDRLANSIAVMSKKNFIILDLGTATTFDVVIGNVYNGGVIAPGINISLNTLIKKATLIPQINLKKIKTVVGKNTLTAVRSGFFLGICGPN